jgi:hypothetical protein
MIQGKGIPQFSGSDAQGTVSVFVQEVIQLAVKLACIRMYGQQRIVQIELQDAIGTIERAIEFCVDDEIIASDIFGRAGTGFHKPALLVCNQQEFFPLADRIPRQEDILGKLPRIIDDFNRKMLRVLENPTGNGQIFAIFGDKDFIREVLSVIHRLIF